MSDLTLKSDYVHRISAFRLNAMVKLNRTTEYGLIALRHMSRKRQQDPAGITSAREVSDYYGLPFEITAKTLQRLKDTGLIQSAQGARGGYMLKRALGDVNLAEFLSLMEGPQSVVACAPAMSPTPAAAKEKSSSACDCEYHAKCEIRGLMGDLNTRVLNFLKSIRLAEIAEGPMSSGIVQLTGAFASAPVTTGVAFQAAGGDEP